MKKQMMKMAFASAVVLFFVTAAVKLQANDGAVRTAARLPSVCAVQM